MRFEVTQPVLGLLPHLAIGIVQGDISAPSSGLQQTIAELRAEAVARMKQRIPTLETLTSHPHIAEWRKAYQAFGVKAKTHKPTHEALVRRLHKDGTWPEINPIVGIYLTNQAAHLLPHGGYDAAALSGTLRLDVSPGMEPFEPLGGGEEVTAPGEVVYRDDRRILTRRWNYRDSDAGKITENTTRFLLMIESPSAEIPAETVALAAKDLVGRFQRCYQGTFTDTLFRPAQEARVMELAP